MLRRRCRCRFRCGCCRARPIPTCCRRSRCGLLDHAEGADMRLLLVKGADHRFSTHDCLGLIEQAVEDLLQLA
ncbi:MAG: hypothetical protein MZV65_02290 [Chromatiales bacterium]|nr:hypothetical protein [Chromatiales bacterium]